MILDSLKDINKNIVKVSKNWNSDRQVNLIAVSKRQSMDKIREAIDAGQKIFGENKVQEAYEHWGDIKSENSDIKLHFVGHLQSNKVKDAVSLFDVIETIGSKKIALKLSEEMKKQNKELDCFIQVNTGGEEQKSGVSVGELEGLIDYSMNECGLNIVGLMCIPPASEPSGLHFAFLRKLAEEYGLKELSMGMSSDYDKAIMAGATYVRVGSALFGDRV